MRLAFLSPGRSHQVVLGLTPSGVDIVHFKRSLWGWKETHVVSKALSPGDAFLAELRAALLECSTQWALPAGTSAHWVVSPDILGIVSQAPDAAGLPALPFPATDVRTQTDNFGGVDNRSLLWIHNDWTAEFESISRGCSLELAELYARGQLFQAFVAKRSKGAPACIVIEGEPAQACLHVYSSGGKLLRSRTLSGGDEDRVVLLLRTESLYLLGGTAGESEQKVALFAPEWMLAKEPLLKSSYAADVLPQMSSARTLGTLWRSAIEGIAIRPTYLAAIRQLKQWSIALGVLGLAVLGVFMWHYGELQERKSSAENQIRRTAQRVQKAKELKANTLHMSEVVDAVGALRAQSQATDTLISLLTVFPTAPATLLHFKADAMATTLTGLGPEATVDALRQSPLPGHTAFEDTPVSESVAAQNPSFALRAQRQSSAPPTTPNPSVKP